MESKRIEYIDVCKGIGILLVVLGHIYRNNCIRTWLYSFHMPLFFFLSGYLYSMKEYSNIRELIIKKARSILIPYFSFAFIFYFYWVLIERHLRAYDTSVSILSPLLGIFYANGNGSYLIFDGALWFLPCLFITEILFFLILRITKIKKLIGTILIGIAVLIYIVSLKSNIYLPWGILNALAGIVFYGLGYIIFKLKRQSNNESIIKKSIALIILLFINIIFAYINGPIDILGLRFGNFFYYYCAAVSGILFMILFSKLIRVKKFFVFLGNNTLIIMCIHEPIKRIVIQISSIITKIPSETLRNDILGGIAIWIILIIVLMPIVFIINRYLPFLIGRKKVKKVILKTASSEG